MSKWISVKERLPRHEETVYVFSGKDQCVSIFLESSEVSKKLISKGLLDKGDFSGPPYFFASLEIRGNVLGGVTHWMPLLEPPA